MLEVLGPAARSGVAVTLSLPREPEFNTFRDVARRLRVSLEFDS